MHLVEGRAECLHELVGKVPHESDRVRQGVFPTARGLGPSHGGVQGREQLVAHQHARVGEPVEQRRLSRVRVAHDGDSRGGRPVPLGPLHGTSGPHRAQLATQLGHLGADAAPVDLEFGLTGSAQRADAAATGGRLAAHGLAPAAQAGQHVFQLGEFHLSLALAAASVLGENVEDEPGPVDDLDLDDLLQLTELPRREFAVADQRVGFVGPHDLGELPRLARPDESAGVGLLAPLHQGVHHHGSGCLGEPRQFGHRQFRRQRCATGPYADQDDPLQPDLAVLHLADVGEFRRQAGDTTQRLTLLELQ